MELTLDPKSLTTYLVGTAIVGVITAIIRLWGMHMRHTRHVAENYISEDKFTKRLQPFVDELTAVKELAIEILESVAELKGKYQGQQDAKRG